MNPIAHIVTIVTLVLTITPTPRALAADAGTDDAKSAAYEKEWTDTSDGSTDAKYDAFGPWHFATTPKDALPASDGFTLADSRTLATDDAGNNAGADINTNGKSFALAGKRDADGKDVESAAYREFKPGGLSPGQTFSLDLAVNYRNGYKGLDVRAGKEGDPDRKNLFTFNVGSDAHTVSNAATNNGPVAEGYAPATRFHVELTQTTATGGTWTLRRNDGAAEADRAAGTYEGVATGIKLYCSGTDAGKEDVVYFNNLKIGK